MNALPSNLVLHRDIEEELYRSYGFWSSVEALQLRLSFAGLYHAEDSDYSLYCVEDLGYDPIDPLSALLSPSSLLVSSFSQHTMENNSGNASLNDIQSTLQDGKLHLRWIYELVRTGANLRSYLSPHLKSSGYLLPQY